MQRNLKINRIRDYMKNIDYVAKGSIYQYDDSYVLAQNISNNIIPYYLGNIYGRTLEEIYYIKDYDSLKNNTYGFHLGIPYYKYWKGDNITTIDRYRFLRKTASSAEEREHYKQKIDEIECKYRTISETFNKEQQKKVEKALLLKKHYEDSEEGLIEYLHFLINDSFYLFDWNRHAEIEYNHNNQIAIIDYYLPTLDECPSIQKYDRNEFDKYLSLTAKRKLYEDVIYKITLRTIAEIFHYDYLKRISTICFNGIVKVRNAGTGRQENNCILSLSVNRFEFEKIELRYVDAKTCFKHLKGVGGAKLYDYSPIVPIMQINKNDKRFVDGHSVSTDSSTNLAAMDWEEFEHLVRELFDLEFNKNGGEVKITQASRDGGVDAIAFDPDPIRGGKIVIQAKRYTNTVGVSAVRDLYGTVINEGANKGILITTSDYGSDSYNFAKSKPITLLNGGHLLYLLEKHGRKARIDIQEAKNNLKNGG